MLKWFNNGGKREIFYTGLVLAVLATLVKTIFAMGTYKEQIKSTIHQVEINKQCILSLQQDLPQIKSDIRVIRVHITGEIN